MWDGDSIPRASACGRHWLAQTCRLRSGRYQAFGLDREAVLLVGGDKKDGGKACHETDIPVADDRFDEHQAEPAAERTK